MIKIYLTLLLNDVGHAVASLVEALCCKPEGRGIESRRGGFFSIDLILPAALCMAFGSNQPLIEMSTRNLPGR
jgi:hypothetical protein